MARLIVSQLKKKQMTTGDGDNNRHQPRWASKEIPASNLHKYEDIFIGQILDRNGTDQHWTKTKLSSAHVLTTFV